MLKNKSFKYAMAACALVAAQASYAQGSEPVDVFYPSWEFGGTLGILNIDDASASRELIDSEAYVFGGFADYVMESWMISLGLDFISYDDNAEFTQRTEDFFGDEDDSTSDANGFVIFAAVGPKWQFGDTLLTVQGGYGHMFASERSISYCDNCYSEDIDIEAGLFGRATVRQNAGPVAIGLTFTQYLNSDDIDNQFALSISTAY